MIERLRCTEGLNQLFHIELDIVHEEQFEGFEPTAVDPQKILGNPMVISAHQPGPTTRYFNGICIRFSQGGRDARFSSYRAELVPKVWMLTQISRSRIFQNKTVPEILDEVLEGYEVDNEINTEGFKPRNYCVQYRESDWDFVSRLMEEEGIYYYFEHTKENHKLILGNTPTSHRVTPTAAKITYGLERSELKDQWIPAIYKWRTDDRMFTGKVELRDYHFQLPTNNLQAIQTSLFEVGKNKELEVYDWPGGYAKRFDGIDPSGDENSSRLDPIFDDRERTVKIRQEELDAKYKQAVAVSNCCAITAGYRFSLIDHPTKKNNIDYIVVAAEHEAYQSPTYISDDVVEAPYSVHFTCMPHGGGHAPFRPERKTPKPIVHGSQTAVVVGNPADEIFVDKYGRVKVHFHWDRSDHNDQRASAWIRVGQLLAGNKWGAAFWPRVGQEVIVDFLEGDPDQPIIVGSTYNEKNLPHYELDKYKTLSYIKTHSTPKAKGFNELRFEDKAKKEQVFIHSQKRYDLRARGSMYETCGGNRQEVIGWSVQDGDEEDKGGNLATTVGGNFDLHVCSDQYIGVDQDCYEVIKGNRTEGFDGYHHTAVKNFIEKNSKTITLEASQKITLMVGSSCIIVDMMGITIQGPMVKINSGGAGVPMTPALIAPPLDAEHADTGEPGYLDRPRTGGGGGGRNWGTTNIQHAPVVKRRDDGTYSVGGDKIIVKGDDDFTGKTLNTLSELYNTPTGRQVMDNINNGTHTTTIETLDEATARRNGALARRENQAGSVTPGVGSDTTIFYNPDVPDGPYTRPDGTTTDLPQAALLGHEMIHAMHNDTGDNLRNNPEPAEPGSNEEESQTIGIHGHANDPLTQNQILEDLGSPDRRTDHDSSVVPAP
ncbi:MAG: type VI secretion system tip protein VgrG [Chloracidobacterium sp.]|nr:type VI secretion system tip protein VgrG [Chloracidobacterium sp.]